ncbi:MAG: ChaN family lipoprotein [Chloracidobacterium sp.]|nr:ChaN family lipoprotein [Chloracidobacterium sp.]MDW8218075.1 ChaN family lipoprotein [Acidobacteriota bacterium]
MRVWGRRRRLQRLVLWAASLSWLASWLGGLSQPVYGQSTTPAYRLYKPDGQPATLDDLVGALARTEVVFIGESHDDPGAHALQLDLLRAAYARYGADAAVDKRQVVLSLEMFERDVQLVLDEYLAGLIPENQFLACSRPWNNYQSDYRPLVEFAKAHQLPVVAANAPRRYVNLVGREGREALTKLSAPARAFLPPLPYGLASEAYEAKFRRLMTDLHGAGGGTHPTSNLSRMLDSQSLWDASMAHAIAETLARVPHPLVVHINGRFHSEEGLGVPEHLAAYRKGTRMLIVTVVAEEADPETFDAARYGKLGDFVALSVKPKP